MFIKLFNFFWKLIIIQITSFNPESKRELQQTSETSPLKRIAVASLIPAHALVIIATLSYSLKFHHLFILLFKIKSF